MSQNSSKYIKVSQTIMRHNWSKVPLLTTGETVGHQSMASLLPPLFKLFAKLWACLSHSDPSLKNTGNQRELEQHKPLMILNHVKKSEMKLKYNELRWDNLAWASCYIMLYSVIKSYHILSMYKTWSDKHNCAPPSLIKNQKNIENNETHISKPTKTYWTS